MGILVLQASARDQHLRTRQRLDHRLVGIALLALGGDHSPPSNPGAASVNTPSASTVKGMAASIPSLSRNRAFSVHRSKSSRP